MIKTITIDFWNTIYDSSAGKQRNAYRQRVLIDQLDTNGIMVMGNQINEAIEASWQNFEYIWKNEHRTPDAFETVSYIWKFLHLPINEKSIKIVANAFADSVIVHPPSLIEGVKESLKDLSQNYELCLISDTGFSPGDILKQLMQKDDILKYFKAFSFSNETGVSKPNPKAFHHVLEQVNCHPNHAIHIGDIESTDIVGAKNLGMKAIRFNGNLTKLVNADNPVETLADTEIDNWSSIVTYIKTI